MFNDINLEENTNWQYSTFDVQPLFNEETPTISKYFSYNLGTDWSESNIKPSPKGIEIRSLIFRTKEQFQLDSVSTEIAMSFSLKGESSLWVILRSDNDFNEYSAILKISKEDKSQNLHVSLGTFVKDVHNNLVYKNFSKQQLIDYSSKNYLKI